MHVQYCAGIRDNGGEKKADIQALFRIYNIATGKDYSKKVTNINWSFKSIPSVIKWKLRNGYHNIHKGLLI